MVLGFFYKSINCFKIIIWYFLEDILVTSDNIEETNNSAMDATPTMTDENQDDFLSDANKGDEKSSLKIFELEEVIYSKDIKYKRSQKLAVNA